jgi:hypothetical protein
MFGRQKINVKGHQWCSIIIGLTILLSMMNTTVVYAQVSDYEMIFDPVYQSSFKQNTVTYARSIDLTGLYDSIPPLKSSLDFSTLQGRPVSLVQSLRLASSSENKPISWEIQLVKILSKWPNIRLVTPTVLRQKLSRSINAKRLVKLASEFTEKSEQAYKSVDLEHSQSLLDSAIELLAQARYVLVNPFGMGLLYLQRGVVAIEQKQLLRAALDFRKALLLAPSLRLKKGFDSEQSVKIFYETLAQLQSLGPQELVKLSEQREWIQDRHSTLVIIRVRSQIFSSLWRAPRNPRKRDGQELSRMQDLVSREQLQLLSNQNINVSLGRLASRIWACLPILIKDVHSHKELSAWHFSSGLGGAMHLKSPVSLVIQRGLQVEASVKLLSQFQLGMGGIFSSSTQDESSDLTESFTTSAMYFGPLWIKLNRIWWFSFGLMIEGSRLSETTITRAVGCKFFNLSSQVPLEICDPQRDIRYNSGVWRFGPRLQLSAGVKLSRRLRLGLQAYGSSSFYESGTHPFEWPIGASILIGYSFNSQ